MTHCYNCGHAGTFVLLAQFALTIPGPDESGVVRESSDHPGPEVGLSVQCPACDSTDVGVAAHDLLARYASSTTS